MQTTATPPTQGSPPIAALTYVLITPARNEEAYIEGTLRSVIAQTHRPLRWVIVSDGSTDRTDDIVKSYTAAHPWIQLVRTPERKERHFAGKVHAFNAGYAIIKGLAYDVIGSLDADITFDADYFAFLLNRFSADSHLGVAGTPFSENGVSYNYRFTSIEHVSGACQLFRRACFQSIGGYVPLSVGGIDLVAVTTARMCGWKTRTFTEKFSYHHRKMGSSNNRLLMASYKSGYHDYLMGMHPLWQFPRSIYQMSKPPFFLGGFLLFAGYMVAAVRRAKRPVSREFVAFRQREQITRLARLLRRD